MAGLSKVVANCPEADMVILTEWSSNDYGIFLDIVYSNTERYFQFETSPQLTKSKPDFYCEWKANGLSLFFTNCYYFYPKYDNQINGIKYFKISDILTTVQVLGVGIIRFTM